MKKYVWVLKISHLNNSPRILCDEDSFVFDCEQSARNAMIRLHTKISCKENCRMVSEKFYPKKMFNFVFYEHFFGVQIIKKLVLTESEVNKFNSIYSVFL
jgi:hypothetical protein